MRPGRPPADLWGLNDFCLEPVQGGHRNTVLRTTGTGPARVFKSTRRSEAAIAWLGPVLDAAEASGFVVARPIPSHRGRLVEAGWTCEPALEGAPFRPDDLPRIAPLLSAFLGRTRGLPQRPGFRSTAQLLHVPRGGDVDLTAMPPALVAACRKAWRGISTVPHAAVHGDLGAQNLLWCADDRPVLFDWDEARRDAPLLDLIQVRADRPMRAHDHAHMAWEIACCWRYEPTRARALARRFLAAYITPSKCRQTPTRLPPSKGPR